MIAPAIASRTRKKGPPSRRSSFCSTSGPSARAAPPVMCARDIHARASTDDPGAAAPGSEVANFAFADLWEDEEAGRVPRPVGLAVRAPVEGRVAMLTCYVAPPTPGGSRPRVSAITQNHRRARHARGKHPQSHPQTLTQDLLPCPIREPPAITPTDGPVSVPAPESVSFRKNDTATRPGQCARARVPAITHQTAWCAFTPQSPAARASGDGAVVDSPNHQAPVAPPVTAHVGRAPRCALPRQAPR